MIGELNASHLGASAPADQTRTTTGRIGVRFDRDEYEKSGRLTVSEVIPLSPADVAKIKVSDTIVAVDGHPLGPQTNFDQLLEYRNGKRTVIKLADRDVTLQPVRTNDEKALTYRAWVNANRAYVDRISGGKLGYVHMIDMSFASLERLSSISTPRTARRMASSSTCATTTADS
jgi:C-terminal processing protease CtpA/Prc